MYVIIKTNTLDDNKKEYYYAEELNPLDLTNTLELPVYSTVKLCKNKYLRLFPFYVKIKEAKELNHFKYDKQQLPIEDKSYIDIYLKCITPECEPLDILLVILTYDFKFKNLNYSDDIIDISITDYSMELYFKKNIKSETGEFYFEIQKFKIALDDYSNNFIKSLSI